MPEDDAFNLEVLTPVVTAFDELEAGDTSGAGAGAGLESEFGVVAVNNLFLTKGSDFDGPARAFLSLSIARGVKEAMDEGMCMVCYGMIA